MNTTTEPTRAEVAEAVDEIECRVAEAVHAALAGNTNDEVEALAAAIMVANDVWPSDTNARTINRMFDRELKSAKAAAEFDARTTEVATTIRVTKMQAEELDHRLSIAIDSQDEADPADRLPVWGSIAGRDVTIESIADCIDDIDSVISYADDGSGEPGRDGAQARALARSMRGLRDKIVEAGQ